MSLRQYFSNFLTLLKITEASNLPRWMGGVWPGTQPLSTTYAELLAMSTGGTLTPGQKYRITDFNNAIVEAISTTEYMPSSNCIASMDWDMSFDMAAAAITPSGTADKDIRFAGIVNLINNGALSTSFLSNFNTNHPVTFVAPAGATFEFIGTAYDDVVDDTGRFLWNASSFINGNYADTITLQRTTITNGNGTFNVIKEVGRSIYG